MYFSTEALADMREKYGTLHQRCQDLVEAFMMHNFVEKQAREYAHHGFGRRFKSLVECMQLVFDNLPPEQEDVPERKKRLDATIGIQGFVFNAFGAIDNLAWIFAIEKSLKNKKGQPLHRNAFGLAKHNTAIRQKLSPEFQVYLSSLDNWFKVLEEFRHSLAHRIPLFIPPYVITPDKQDAFNTLQTAMNAAAAKGDYETYNAKSAEQDALGIFHPVMLHSVVEMEHRIVFHPQLIADFTTVEEIGQKMIAEL
jgi:hypothetical protein